ncbi:hypothetical protein P873_12335 [Arenimonas composti TR7-09 = DSM 18010]|uniref:Uncharacterized protein n=1 Tax=Arenimonas composti TR7-09 = DSM 18010 TaxID=1121013 RepID=A0A091BXK1_9GAMM|nr:hypothetical protein P873_12335 [Arenimonas composti TR7-09 = DSM 18010]
MSSMSLSTSRRIRCLRSTARHPRLALECGCEVRESETLSTGVVLARQVDY